jgi:undecaprenyl-diphosphatase
MNDSMQAFFLGILQGITEFLPISSSAHLILLPWLVGWEAMGLTFDVVVHGGTLLALVIYFRQQWKEIGKQCLRVLMRRSAPSGSGLLGALVVGTLPAIAVGGLFEGVIETHLRAPGVTVLTLSLFGLLLGWADHQGSQLRSLESIRLRDGLLVGLAQAFALIPGVSRSGVTITATLMLGLNRADAARFSFLLGTPVIAWCNIFFCKRVSMYQVSAPISSNSHLSSLRRLSTAACCLYLCLAGSIGFALGTQEEEEEEVSPARQNLILRAHFRQQFANMRSFNTSGRGRRDPFLEDYVDRQIDNYLEELTEKLAHLNSHFGQLEQAQEIILQDSSAQAVSRARLHWRNSLKGVQDKSGDLWNMLRYVLTVLEDKGDLKPLVPQEPDSVYPNETRFIGEQISKAEKRIREYFFQTHSVIELEDLKGENMLIHLYLAREMAKRIRKASQ